MMMDYDKLLEQLRSTVSRSKRELLDDAAAAIESLMAEAERNLDAMEALKAHLYDVEMVELPKVKAERDAAIAEIKYSDGCESCKHAGSDDPFCMDYDFDCECCTSELCVCRHCQNEDKWEWRGPQREEK